MNFLKCTVYEEPNGCICATLSWLCLGNHDPQALAESLILNHLYGEITDGWGEGVEQMHRIGQCINYIRLVHSHREFVGAQAEGQPLDGAHESALYTLRELVRILASAASLVGYAAPPDTMAMQVGGIGFVIWFFCWLGYRLCWLGYRLHVICGRHLMLLPHDYFKRKCPPLGAPPPPPKYPQFYLCSRRSRCPVTYVAYPRVCRCIHTPR